MFNDIFLLEPLFGEYHILSWPKRNYGKSVAVQLFIMAPDEIRYIL